jgi:hypothetical protein
MVDPIRFKLTIWQQGNIFANQANILTNQSKLSVPMVIKVLWQLAPSCWDLRIDRRLRQDIN